jgi:hypothetical protein
MKFFKDVASVIKSLWKLKFLKDEKKLLVDNGCLGAFAGYDSLRAAV